MNLCLHRFLQSQICGGKPCFFGSMTKRHLAAFSFAWDGYAGFPTGMREPQISKGHNHKNEKKSKPQQTEAVVTHTAHASLACMLMIKLIMMMSWR